MGLTQVSTSGIKDATIATADIADQAVTSNKIANGTIDNVDISTSAAITGSKIVPDFGSQNITTTGTIGSGDITISGTAPRLILTDSNNDSDFRVNVDAGLFSVQDTSNSFASRLEIGSDGRFRVGCTAQPSSTVGGFQLDMGSYPGTLRLMSGAGASGTATASLAIGGSNHHANLHNGSNSGGQLNLYNYNTTDGNSTSVSFHNSNALGIARILGHNESHSNRTGNLVFMVSDGTYPQEAMRLTHDGRLAIGTTNPDQTFTLKGLSKFEATNSTNGWVNYTYTDNTFRLNYNGAGNDEVIIDSAGNVGVGVTPTARLHASAPYNVTAAKISGGAANYSNALEVSNAGGTNLLTVKGDGDVGIGTASPSVRCDISDSDTTAWGPGTNLSTALRVVNTGAANGVAAGIQLRNFNNNGNAGIQYIHAVNNSTSYSSDLVFSRRLANSGNYAEALRVQNGGGISFNGDTAAANALDDYEEGTWTPFVGTQSGSDYTVSSSYNCYTKIGNIVHAFFSYTFTAEGNGSITLFNIPFAAASSAYQIGQGYVTSGNNRLSLQYVKYNSTLLLPRVDDGVNYQNYWTSRGSWAPTNSFVCWITYKV